VPPASVWAGADSAGTAHATTTEMTRAVRNAKRACEAVVVMLHWGEEKTDESSLRATPERRKLARALVNAGASAVLGSHSHSFEEYERYDKGVIFYGLGNFVFTGTSGAGHPASAIARITIDGTGDVTKVQVIPVDIAPGRARYSPIPLPAKPARAFLERVREANGAGKPGQAKTPTP